MTREGVGAAGVFSVGSALAELLDTGAVGVDELGIVEGAPAMRSEEHTSELQSHYSISYAVFCLQTS